MHANHRKKIFLENVTDDSCVGVVVGGSASG